MNERIKELAEQAGLYDEKSPDEVPEFTASFEKFAELLIRECTGIVENLPPGYIDYRNQIEDAFRRDCVGKIQEQFGIE